MQVRVGSVVVFCVGGSVVCFVWGVVLCFFCVWVCMWVYVELGIGYFIVVCMGVYRIV